MSDLDALTALMAESVLAHVEGATREARDVVGLPFGGLRVKVRVQAVMHQGRVVQQHAWLHGGVLGSRWIEDNFVGMADATEAAVVRGAHDWVAGSFHAVRAWLRGERAPHTLRVDAIDYDVYTSPRGLRGRGAEVSGALPEPLVLRYADVLPVLYDGPTFVSTFVARGGVETVEVKVDGSDWPTRDAVGTLPWPAGDDYASVRELSVLVPKSTRVGWPPAERIRTTLARLPRSEAGPRVYAVTGHRWRVDPPLAAAPEGVPEDYAWYLTQVSASGAGPAHGLLSPVHEAQAALREGVFDGTAPRGVIALAHHGCGAMSLLVCGGPHHGEVWVDARVQDAGFRRIAGSFREYYLEWLLRAPRREPSPRVIDPRGCAMPRALSSFLESKPGVEPQAAIGALPDLAIATKAGGDEYFDAGDALDLCIGCWDVGTSLGLEPRHVVPGVPPKQGRNAAPSSGGWPTKTAPKKW